MLIACMCTPIFINASVVFVRLYWFEKRFQNVVIDARSRGGRTRTMSKRKSEMNAELDRDMEHEERGVGNREIRVMRATNGHAEGGTIEDEHAFVEGANGAGIRKTSSSDDGDGDVSPFERPTTPVHQTASNVVWADNLSTPVQQERQRLQESVGTPQDRLPEVDKEKSIAFVEAQRNPTEKAKLRIPGPRDFDRGLMPEKVDEEQLSRMMSRVSHESYQRHERSNSVPAAAAGDDHPFRHHITIDVPHRDRPTTGASVYNRTKTADVDAGAPTPAMQLRSRSRSRTLASFLTRTKDEDEDPMPYLSWTPTLGRNSNFVDLSEEQREELGGIEYRALKLLAMILVGYFVGFHLMGMICLTPWINENARYRAVVEASNVTPTWWGFFTPASMFNDLGFTLTPDSMVSFQFAVLPLLLGTFLIIIGNTGFPCMLRFVIWAISKLVPRGSGVWEELRFLLDHPRRCFTLLFPSKANWWLFAVLVFLNGIDLIFFIILDVRPPSVYMFTSLLTQHSSTIPPSPPSPGATVSSLACSKPPQHVPPASPSSTFPNCTPPSKSATSS